MLKIGDLVIFRDNTFYSRVRGLVDVEFELEQIDNKRIGTVRGFDDFGGIKVDWRGVIITCDERDLISILDERLLRDCIRGLLFERIRPRAFDLRKFKELPLEEQLSYAKQHLKPLGKGSARAVFLFSSRFVLKVALNKKGLAQNEAENSVSLDPISKPIVAHVKDHAPDNTWLISELVRPVHGSREFESLVGLNETDDYEYNIDLYDFVHAAFNGDFEKLRGQSERVITLAQALFDTASAYQLEIGDLEETHHWGKTPDGRVVLLDYGFTTDVFNKHYLGSSSASSSAKTT